MKTNGFLCPVSVVKEDGIILCYILDHYFTQIIHLQNYFLLSRTSVLPKNGMFAWEAISS